MTTKRICYMDKVDFDHEIGNALGGNQLFADIEDLKKHKGCCRQCGIVKVEVVLKEVIQESDFSKGKKYTSHELNTIKVKELQINMHRMMIGNLEKDIQKLTNLETKGN